MVEYKTELLALNEAEDQDFIEVIIMDYVKEGYRLHSSSLSTWWSGYSTCREVLLVFKKETEN